MFALGLNLKTLSLATCNKQTIQITLKDYCYFIARTIVTRAKKSAHGQTLAF